MAFGAHDIQPARFHHDLLRSGGVGFDLGRQFRARGFALRFRQGGDLLFDLHVHIAAELNVGAAAGHVGGDRHRAGLAGLGDNKRFLFVEPGIEHVVLDIVFLQELRQQFRFFDRDRTHQDRLVLGLGLADVFHDRVELFFGRTIDLVVLVDADLVDIRRDFDDFKAIDFRELAGFRHRRTGHAGKLRIKPEIVLERDRGEGLVLVLDGDAFLCFQRLVQTFGKPPSFHHAAGEFVDDDDLVILDDVIGVALEQGMGAQRLLYVVHQRHVGDVVKRGIAEQAHFAEDAFDVLGAGFGKRDRALFFVFFEVFGTQLRNDLVDGRICVGGVFRRTGNDQRRTRLVDEDVIDLVDDRVMELALDHLVDAEIHIVAQIVETVFVIRAVGDVAGIGALAFGIVEPVFDAADGHAEKFVDHAHPCRVARGEVIVDRHNVNALAGDRVQIDRQGGHQRLAFAGAHLGDLALMKHHAAEKLHIVVPLAEGALRGFPDRGEGFDHHVVQRFAVCVALAEFFGARLQLIVRQLFELRLDRIDLCDQGLEPLYLTIIGAAKNTLRNRL